MSLLQNEDFVLYQLRTSYLASIKDGVGERLINVNSSVLNQVGFRAAGWAPNPADIKRTYSPPIPTAITSEYFQAPRSAGLKAPEGFGDDEEEGGMVTGGGSNDTVGPTLNAKRRRRKELLEEDDSSDLSDESDEDDASDRPANQIKFTKMPLRTRSGSSPVRGSALRNELADGGDQPSVTVTSPSRPPDNLLSKGSFGSIDAVKGRARRDTITSSEMSSENEFDNSGFQKRRVKHVRKAASSHQLLSNRINEDGEDANGRLEALHEGNESDSSLDSEFSGSADSGSLMGDSGHPLDSSPSAALPGMPALTPYNNQSPKRRREPPQPTLQALPPPRPISFILPVSALTQALQAKSSKPLNPLARFAVWNAASEAQSNPLYLKLYCPWSAKPLKPMELLLRKFNDKGEGITVAEAIGYALHRYQEEKIEPPLASEQCNVNCWVMRMWDDDEVDDEFPPLTRNKPLKDFASNNSRGMRPRARDKPWDEFALVEASQREIAENDKVTPIYSEEAAASVNSQKDLPEEQEEAPKQPAKPIPNRAKSFRNPITGPSFAPKATRKDTSTLADAPTTSSSHAASRVGAPKTVNVHYTDENFNTRHIPVPCTTDTYIDEIFDKVCHDLHLDKALYLLKVSQSTTVAPLDRTVEALGKHADVDLLRRRFIADGIMGLSGSPGSSSPNAPLIISTGGAPKKTKKGDRVHAAVSGQQLIHPLARNVDAAALALTSTGYYRRYAVLRKQPMSFASSTSRIIALDNEYIHIMPGESGRRAGAVGGVVEGQGKTTTVHFSSVVGTKVSKKHPKTVRLLVYREKETKRYDFEAASVEEAADIVKEIKKGVERFQEGIV
ncbi:Component of a membrane-bound complex containing the Tor2p kinase [Didymella glomerata]|jgi:hypothetical protein|uniref:Component of a membrane-bound complex containing the Tor2p kinase n=1 Tax=Didymella glomerata TaxID=749621 RepID=A0A9W8X273_9PLEO|nr:Component of a membrane-bound complex containing the Tor2p kinase [Didymella glomerata]